MVKTRFQTWTKINYSPSSSERFSQLFIKYKSGGGVEKYSVFNKLRTGNNMDPITSKIMHCLFVPLHCSVLEKYIWIVANIDEENIFYLFRNWGIFYAI